MAAGSAFAAFRTRFNPRVSGKSPEGKPWFVAFSEHGGTQKMIARMTGEELCGARDC
jgi:hypothetical protein